MSDKRKPTKIDRISPSKGTRRVDPTEAIRSVDAVRPTARVSGVAQVGGVRTAPRSERALTRTERDKLLGMIREEADRLFAGGSLPKAQREIVKRAVTMAVDAGIIVEEEGEEPTVQETPLNNEAEQPGSKRSD